MAITSISITQDNLVDNCDLLAVHNPLVFLAAAVYTGEAPESLYIQLLDEDDVVLNTFAAIPYSDATGVRTFAFMAAEILRAYMDEIDDFEGNEGLLEYVEGITCIFTIKFYSGAIHDDVTFTAIHAAGQFGGGPALEDVYNNADETYYAGKGMPVYVYFYNADTDNIITIDSPTPEEVYATDYDDVNFYDHDDLIFKIL